MSAQHTPGPWFNNSQDDTPMGEVADQPLDSGVTLHISVSGPNAKADARLIAAAPDLLTTLRDVLRIATAASAGLSGNRPRLERARTAIAKAIGSAS